LARCISPFSILCCATFAAAGHAPRRNPRRTTPLFSIALVLWDSQVFRICVGGGERTKPKKQTTPSHKKKNQNKKTQKQKKTHKKKQKKNQKNKNNKKKQTPIVGDWNELSLTLAIIQVAHGTPPDFIGPFQRH